MQVNEWDRARAALAFVPSEDRDTWVRVGMALKAEFGEAGRELWDEWSQQAESYKAADVAASWRSFREGGGITIASLYHEAKQGGWTPNGYGAPRALGAEEIAERESMAREARDREERAAAAAKAKATKLWQKARDVPDHPYIKRKGVPLTKTLRAIDRDSAAAILGYGPKCDAGPLTGSLLVALIKVGDEFTSAEMIDAAGRKVVIAGSTVKGGYWAAQAMPEHDGETTTIAVAEGIATTLSVRQATGHLGIAARSCGNLLAVAQAMRQRYPRAKIVVCGDVGPGEDKAREAAASVDGVLALPDFGADRPDDGKDFNDLHQHRGVEAVRKSIAAAKRPEVSEPQPSSADRPRVDVAPRIAFRRFSEIEARPVDWLWPGRIARGKLTVIAGNPNLGKSQTTCYLAAVVSTGGNWADGGGRCAKGGVIYLSAEDEPEDTIKPRLLAAGADVALCYNLDAVVERDKRGGEIRRSFNLEADLLRLGEMADRVGDVSLVIVDPISSYLGGVNSYNNAEMRALLAPLSALAAKHGFAVVLVSHLTKGGTNEAMMRVTGSLALVAAARSAFAVVQDKEDEARRLFLVLKSNLSPSGGATGLAFKIEGETVESPSGPIGSSRVVWESEPVTITAQEAMAPAADPEERSDLDDAKAFLLTILEDGPLPSKRVFADAKGAGYSEATMRRAKKALGVEATKKNINAPWELRLPAKALKSALDAHPKSVSALGENERLVGAGENAEVL